MSNEQQSNWTTWVALSTAAMAVLAALTTLYLGKYSSRTVLMQMQESDQWAFYQAKSIKGNNYELQKELLELEFLSQKSKLNKDLGERFQKTAESYEKNIKRYDSEKNEIKGKAEELGRQKQAAQAHGSNFGYSLIFLQIGIMLSSISAITKKKPLWYFGLLTAIGGVFFFIDGFYLFL